MFFAELNSVINIKKGGDMSEKPEEKFDWLKVERLRKRNKEAEEPKTDWSAIEDLRNKGKEAKEAEKKEPQSPEELTQKIEELKKVIDENEAMEKAKAIQQQAKEDYKAGKITKEERNRILTHPWQ